MSNAIKRHISGPVHSRVVEYNGLVFVAGLTADNRNAGCKEQTEEILKKIDAALELAGTSKSRLLSATVWLTDIRQWTRPGKPGSIPKTSRRAPVSNRHWARQTRWWKSW
jgi:enamine deaminase RidA (YjgF/YER057c/UK114 family)